MSVSRSPATIAVLLSGGLDSAILVGHLLEHGFGVQPLYVQTGQFWQREERAAVTAYLQEIARPALRELVSFEQPLADLYGEHWSMTGRAVPGAETPDEAVYMPGRNALLLLKPALWCQMQGIGELALGSLKHNPFADATPEFFADMQEMLELATGVPIRLTTPLAQYEKRQVMQLGRHLPLEKTFSCIRPVDGRHCGACNKCAERQAAFRRSQLADRTSYAVQPDAA